MDKIYIEDSESRAVIEPPLYGELTLTIKNGKVTYSRITTGDKIERETIVKQQEDV